MKGDNSAGRGKDAIGGCERNGKKRVIEGTEVRQGT